MTAYAADTWLTPIVLDATNNVFVITEDPGGANEQVLVCTLDAGTWFLHDDTSWHATKKGLLYGIRKLLTDGTTAGVGTKTGTTQNAYTWACVDPASSTGLSNNGLQLRSDSANYSFEISWTHASFTLDAFLLGATLTSPIADTASSTSGSDEIITMPWATKHRMCTRDLFGDGISEEKTRVPYKDAERSSSRPSDAVSVVWDEGYYRPFLYLDVPAVEVQEHRARESEWAATQTRATGDINATWFDVYDALTDDLEVVVVHNSTDDFQVDTHEHEVGKLYREQDWGPMFTKTTRAGERYDVSILLWVDTANSDYDH